MRITIYDIARQLNISAATVSRVLNGKGDALISEATRQRVRKTADEMGYRPNVLARALITGRTSTIGLFTRSIEERVGPHFARMLEAVELKAAALGYRLVVSGDLESILGEGRVDGVVILGSREVTDSTLGGKPCVFVANGLEILPGSVIWSDFDGAYQGGKYLVSLGHHKVCAIWGNIGPEQLPSYAKANGFHRAMEEAGADCLKCTGELSKDGCENGYLLTRRLLDEHSDVTAFFARNDFLALGAMKAIKRSGRSIPEDVSVVGYNDTILAKYADPEMTSVRTPIAEAGEIAVEHLVRMVEQESDEFPGILLPVTLSVRESCTNPRSGG